MSSTGLLPRQFSLLVGAWASLPSAPTQPLRLSMTAPLDKTIQAAQAFVGQELDFSRLDQIYDLQRLLGPVLAYKILLEIAINAEDAKERRLAASQLLQAADEDPEKVAERLRASVFHDLSLEDLQAIVQSGITDPRVAVARLREIKEKDAGA